MIKIKMEFDHHTGLSELVHGIRTLEAELISRVGIEEAKRLMLSSFREDHHSHHHCRHSVAVGLVLKVSFKDSLGSLNPGGDMITIRDDSLGLSLSVQGVDAKGNPATLEAGEPPLVWTLQGDVPAVLVLTPAADGLSCDVAMGTGVGKCQVKAERAADDAKGLKDILGLLDVEVVGGPAVNLVVNAVEKTPPAPPAAPAEAPATTAAATS